MTNKEALKAFSDGQELDQPTVRRLMSADLVRADNITTLDTPGHGSFYKITVITTRGQELLEG